MRLSKYKIRELIELIDERNLDGSITEFYGININKEFMPTVANTENVDPTKYKVVRYMQFVYSGMQTGRDRCIRIALFKSHNPILISPAYTTFKISTTSIILPEYFFMLFLRKEMDRYGSFLSDSSIRANLDWERFCEIEIDLPSINIQQKFVEVYNAMTENQKVYENGLDDLKLTCDAYIEDLRRKMPLKPIGEYILKQVNSNSSKDVKVVKGVDSNSEFIETRAKMSGVDISKYNIVNNGDFVYNPSRINLGSVALYRGQEKCIVSPMYEIFRISNQEVLLPEYLMMWFSRTEFQRYTWFYSSGSVRDTFDLNLMKEVKIPIPDIKLQKSIANLYYVYITRKQINDKLKASVNNICSVLIKGSLEEALNT